METRITDEYQRVSEEGYDTECEKVANMLDMVIDGEASTEEQVYFNNHLEKCVSCFESHQKQKLLKGLVSGHLKRVIVPESLALSIKAKIQETL
ncbi:putative zinc finger protein [Pontibacter ummariensis]|uniref:Putative zinc-finger n=1 Tax=Pontibacter ummariensis TaxID=1610492 RepID=A0A239AXL9_9BACT|nr:zf-HC2 domain-containing protein [Pontibacter ummariensis]PRY16174.1 putative zinc finger protein [Pontibacter ummariensis]SNS00476.1 Putative zinc-finger [Pontibacter ummariensis]